MSGLRMDMSGHQKVFEQKSRPGAKIMRLGPDELAISKLDNIEIREITGTTTSNMDTRIQI
jgi:hypothetical protein